MLCPPNICNPPIFPAIRSEGCPGFILNYLIFYNGSSSRFKEYERAVMFRLGLLLSGGARGPGVFFIVPCVDIVEIIDMRVQTFNVPPQEVKKCILSES